MLWCQRLFASLFWFNLQGCEKSTHLLGTIFPNMRNLAPSSFHLLLLLSRLQSWLVCGPRAAAHQALHMQVLQSETLERSLPDFFLLNA